VAAALIVFSDYSLAEISFSNLFSNFVFLSSASFNPSLASFSDYSSI